MQEIDLIAAASGARRMVEIQWGGGTPNILNAEQFGRVIERLRQRFDVSGVAHHAMEIDPRYIDKAKAAAYAAGGVNRASLGVQDLYEHVQGAIGRGQALEAAGYVAIGIDHYARESDELAQAATASTLTRSFQGYVVEHADALIGFGASAISTYPQGYAQNLAEPGAWGRAVADGHLPIARGHALQGDDDVRRRLIMQIMCDFTGDLAPMGGAAACRAEIAALRPMIEDGFVAIDGDRILVSEAGRPFCRLVARAFDSYAGGAPARHSRAV